MDARFDKLDKKLDKISEDISEIKITQAEQAKDLRYHIKRTTQIENSLLPIVQAKHKLDGAFKVIGIIASIAGFVVAVLKLIFG